MVAALGYFVDIYDLLLFGIVRVPSLKAIGVPEDQLLAVGINLINFQMAGMLVGGILWGIAGDKAGRLSVLFGSILMYSLANIANAFVTDPQSYALLRFVAGVGLAGELGAAITLVSEMMSKETRGIGTTIVASVGILGAVFASFVGDMFDWKVAYIVGGCMGLALLVLRLKMLESGMFESVKHKGVRRGDFFMLFKSPQRFSLYMSCILIGIPIWFVIGILITFSPELAKELGVTDPIRASTAIMTAYIGLSLGDLASGLLSQYMKNRRKVVMLFLTMTLLGVVAYVNAQGISATAFYFLCSYLGFSVGYWAVFVTVAAEQFGTNLRATVATTVPNFVRGSVVLLTLSFRSLNGSFSLTTSALILGLISLAIASFALTKLHETFGKDLDYIEAA
jgi:MFS transporter, putative metabolite:H+ symporter